MQVDDFSLVDLLAFSANILSRQLISFEQKANKSGKALAPQPAIWAVPQAID
jgi:hypothetical protein